jgi:hypothetical protein
VAREAEFTHGSLDHRRLAATGAENRRVLIEGGNTPDEPYPGIVLPLVRLRFGLVGENDEGGADDGIEL